MKKNLAHLAYADNEYLFKDVETAKSDPTVQDLSKICNYEHGIAIKQDLQKTDSGKIQHPF